MVVAGLDSLNQRIAGIDAADAVGLQRLAAKPLFQAGAKVGTAQVQLGSDGEVDLVAPRNLAVTIPAGLCRAVQTKLKIRYQGPVKAPIAKGQHIADLVVTDRRHGDAGGAAGRRRGGRRGRLLRPHLARPQAAVRDGVSGARRFISLEGGEGAGKSTQVAGARRGACRARASTSSITREPGGSAGAEEIRELLLTGDEERWNAARRGAAVRRRARRPCRQDHPAGAGARANGCCRDRFVDSSLAYQGGAGGLGIEAVRAINAFGIGDLLARPDAGAGARPKAARGPGPATAMAATGSAGGPRTITRRSISAFRADRRRGAGAGPADRRLGRAGRSHRSACSTRSRTCCRDRRPGHGGRAVRRAPGERGTLHHAWLLAGPQGRRQGAASPGPRRRGCWPRPPGRRSTCRASKRPHDHPIARLVAAGSHPDMRWLERLENEKTGGLARNISVDQVRALGELFDLTPACRRGGRWSSTPPTISRASAANALLKMLEEPPANCLFLLVSHAPGRLLPTIRSRCRRLDFQPLDDDAMTSLLEARAARARATRERLADRRHGRRLGRAGRWPSPRSTSPARGGRRWRSCARATRPTPAARSWRSELGQQGARPSATPPSSSWCPALIAREARRLDGAGARAGARRLCQGARDWPRSRRACRSTRRRPCSSSAASSPRSPAPFLEALGRRR